MMVRDLLPWRRMVFGAAVLALASCQRLEAPPVEAAREMPAAEQERSASCRQWATVQVEREFARAHPDPGLIYGRPIALRERFDRFDAEKRHQMLYQQCMASEQPVQVEHESAR